MALTYKDAGVDIDEGDRLVEMIKPFARPTLRPEVLAGIGGFGGLFALDLKKWKEPVMVSGTDGVGTKLKVAFTANRHDTVGIDLVAIFVNDIAVANGERVGTLAWNGHRHMELYYAVSGMGAVLHTLNPRLHPEQLAWIANHADDRVLCFDMTFLPLVEAVCAHMPQVRHFVAMTGRAHMPAASKIPNLLCYEELLQAASDRFDWPQFDENRASSLCYTSGTTGNPKGALYSHRSTVLHTYAAALPDSLNLSSRDTVLPVVPMFHVNAWGLPYAACMVGAKLVFPGPHLDGKSLHDLFEGEQVTLSDGVPTVWQGLLGYVGQNQLRFSTMKRTVIGGSACPPAMMTTFQCKVACHRKHRALARRMGQPRQRLVSDPGRDRGHVDDAALFGS